MGKYKVDGMRTFCRVSDKDGNLVAYVGSQRSAEEAQDRAQLIAAFLGYAETTRDVLGAVFGQEAINIAVREAVEAEREACAKLAETYGHSLTLNTMVGEFTASTNIARLIRRRSQE